MVSSSWPVARNSRSRRGTRERSGSAAISFLSNLRTAESLGRPRPSQTGSTPLLGCSHPALLFFGLGDERRQGGRLAVRVDRHEYEVRGGHVRDLSGQQV